LGAVQRVELAHRDVKPRNILVDVQEDRADHVYLSDFGVTKRAAPSMNLTVTGQFLDTPAYAAPPSEQIQGRAGPWTDAPPASERYWSRHEFTDALRRAQP
jgi:serine/threonine protein kinase